MPICAMILGWVVDNEGEIIGERYCNALATWLYDGNAVCCGCRRDLLQKGEAKGYEFIEMRLTPQA